MNASVCVCGLWLECLDAERVELLAEYRLIFSAANRRKKERKLSLNIQNFRIFYDFLMLH
jgi:hypothetical protein